MNELYIVGERGPEWHTPTVSGVVVRIEPTHTPEEREVARGRVAAWLRKSRPTSEDDAKVRTDDLDDPELQEPDE